MSFEPKTRREIEIDELNIKSHLNTSLEADEISVSENLISRTLDAIRLNESNDSDRDKENNNYKRPLLFRHNRTLITVAAAVLILVVGFSALRTLSPIGMKSDMSKSDNTASYDDAGKTEMFSTTERVLEEDSVAFDFDVAGEEFKADSKMTGYTNEVILEDANEEREQSLENDMVTTKDEEPDSPNSNDRIVSSSGYILTITDIILTEANDVKEISVASQTTDDMNIISDKEQIEAFYSMMEKYSFMENTIADTDMHYVVNITSEDKESQISIGERAITVDIVHDGIMSQSIYSTADHIMLLKDLKELLGD